jgi:PAS domain S-box-containing protein
MSFTRGLPSISRFGGVALIRPDATAHEHEGAADLPDRLAAGEPPAFAADRDGRIVFWNRGAERLIGRRASEVLGRKCFDVVRGRDVFGNRFCHESCAVASMMCRSEPVQTFEMAIEQRGRSEGLRVTIVPVPGARPELYTLVHILDRVDGSGRPVRALERASSTPLASTLHATVANPSAPVLALTEREMQVLRCVARGLQNKEVAQDLGISPATVRNHVHNILAKLGVHSKLEVVSLSFRNGWVGVGSERED